MANDAGTAFVDVQPDLKGFGSRLSRGIDPHIDRSSKNVESKLGGAFKGVAVAAGGAFAALGAASFAKDLIGGASDLNETISKSNTIFGQNAKEIEKWAGTAAKSIGQSKQGALDAAATFGNLFVQLGTATDEASKMSTQMVELASDFASFHNADPTEVIVAMTAAFRGEFDAVQRYVPTINAAAVEQEALRMGLAKSTKELTAQHKALATQSLLMKGAGAAVGDFARTSDGLANRQRILAAQFQDTKDRLGTALLPVVLRVMEGFMSLGSALAGPVKRAFGTIKDVASGLFDIFAKRDFTGGFSALGIEEDSPVIAGLFQLRDIATETAGVIKDNLTPAFAGLGTVLAAIIALKVHTAFVAMSASVAKAGGLLAVMGGPVTLVVAGLAALAAGTVYAYKNFDSFRDVVDGVIGWLGSTVQPAIAAVTGYIRGQFANLAGWTRENWAAIQEAVSHVVNVIAGIIRTVVGGIQAYWRTFGDEIVAVARAVWDQIRNTIETAIDLVRGIIETTLALINGDWGQAWDGIKGILSTAWEFMRETVVNVLRIIREQIEAALDVIRGIWERVWGGIRDVFGNIWEAIKNLVRAGVRAVVDSFLGMVETVLNAGARLLGWAGPIGSALKEAARDFAEFRDNVNASLGGIQDKTIELFLKANDRNLGTAGDPIYANKGRLVPGQGNSDTVPAWLTPGEFVVRKEAVKALGVPYLEQLNARGYATGGLVDFQWHLPGVGGIRSAAQAMFDDMASTAAEAFREKAQAAADARAASGAIGGGTGVGGSWQGITAGLDAAGVPYTVTSAYRPGDPGFHGRGKAVDLVGDMARIFHTIAGFSGINELFYDPIGWYIDEGRKVSGAIGDHDDHVHAATFHSGGIVPGSPGQDRLAVVEAGERISPVGEAIDYERLGAAVAAALRQVPPVVRVDDVNRAQHASSRKYR